MNPNRLFENLADANSALRFFIYSPAVQAIEFAAQTFPLAKPVPKLKDEHPLMESPIDPAALLPQPETHTSTVPMWLASLSLTTAALAVIGGEWRSDELFEDQQRDIEFQWWGG